MSKRIAALALVALVGALIGGGVSAAGSGISYPTTIRTLEVDKHQKIIDNGAKGFGVGDVVTIHEHLANHRNSRIVGSAYEVCTVILPKRFSLECSATMQFAEGQISVSGQFPPIDPDHSYVITGGTGAYENVGGHVVVSPSPIRTAYLDFHLVP
jgi:hypothetical protein